ncbi:leucine dehydrogenase [Limimonas halophila]|uniref:Leucine dehydrogenase n=1 Tax=Limimonas halophila TaxID=1082479 RepID=A0A1G7RL33_9PROT|nr:Glu/Leu/Phe/Val dehydrogenase family protein [Limimonas halophila]SDG11423.1 leucine dehydrogenase [Limimonas halophila]
MYPYPDAEAALTDVLRLSRGMTYKNALAELPFGGGKSVLIGDPHSDKTRALFHGMGRAVDALGGRYKVAEDSGIAVPDVDTMGEVTPHVAGTTADGSSDPSPVTAWGVFHGMRAALRHRHGSDSFAGRRVAVQGVGAVGRKLCRHLAEAGAELVVADTNPEAAREAADALGAAVSEPDALLRADADILAPCAMGAVLNDATIPELRAGIVAGAANNQLEADRHAEMLSQRGVLYAPDYAVNAGGVINISHGGPGYDAQAALAHAARIHDTLLEIFQRAEREATTTAAAADRVAETRFTPRGRGPI